METVIAITDVTRMRGQHVCVAGCTPDGACIRPTRFEGLTEPWLYQRGEAVIRPFAVVTLDLEAVAHEPPHSEDMRLRSLKRDKRLLLPEERRRALLEKILDPDVATIFGTTLHEDRGWYTVAGEGSRSLGTIRVDRLDDVRYCPRNGRFDYRLSFRDGSGRSYALKVNDLSFRYYLDHLRAVQGHACADISAALFALLSTSDVYLRLGLTRGWDAHPDRCYLQITGVHTFPDYLAGRCFADFAPNEWGWD